jgi:hypothetical protein
VLHVCLRGSRLLQRLGQVTRQKEHTTAAHVIVSARAAKIGAQRWRQLARVAVAGRQDDQRLLRRSLPSQNRQPSAPFLQLCFIS